MNIALILSGGTGSRIGAGIPKQYIEVGGRTVISYCMERLSAHSGIDGIQIAAAREWHGKIWEGMGSPGKFKGFSKPGENRQLTILNGLEDIRKYAEDSDCVLIHDAARPMLSDALISHCLKAMEGRGGAIPVLPMKDTVYFSKDSRRITSLLNREQIYAGQAPEVFRLGPYLKANRKLLPDKILEIKGSTEPAVLAGMDVAMIPGDEGNFKITTREDLERFSRIIEGKCDRGGSRDEGMAFI